VRYWRKQKEILKNAKSESRAFRGPRAGKSAYFTHPDFSAAELEKKIAQITRVNTVVVSFTELINTVVLRRIYKLHLYQ
jgi:hypothetical protein